MSRFVTLTWLAVRELWITFRLLLVVGLLVLAALPVALVPQAMTPGLAGGPPDALTWSAMLLAGALALVGAFAAATMARERRRGTAGWMVERAIPRPSVVLAWFAAFGILLVMGLVPAAVLIWLGVGTTLLPSGAGPLVAAVGSAGCAGLAGVGLGLMCGSLLPTWPAALVSALPCGLLLVAAATGQAEWWSLPVAGITVLAHLDTASRPVADSLRGGGAALGLAAALLVGAVVAFERADL